jgi:hypothetical protein
MSDYEIAAHRQRHRLFDRAPPALSWSKPAWRSQRGDAGRYRIFRELVAAWSLIASERGIDSLDGLLIDVVAVH